jgi:hypothetical protein
MRIRVAKVIAIPVQSSLEPAARLIGRINHKVEAARATNVRWQFHGGRGLLQRAKCWAEGLSVCGAGALTWASCPV